LKDRYPDMKIVAAHLGGYLMLEEAQKWIIGKDIYIDTCWCPNVLGLDSEEVSRLIRDHGIEKVLFGTDYPSTTDPGPQIEWIRNLDLNTKEKECIFHDNARRLLGL
ncbi:MAG: amidohydrolase family protein, partial [Bacteroidia bacterium]|nr:amidohydrolase family protein [Bacteroidia bacterium]